MIGLGSDKKITNDYLFAKNGLERQSANFVKGLSVMTIYKNIVNKISCKKDCHYLNKIKNTEQQQTSPKIGPSRCARFAFVILYNTL